MRSAVLILLLLCGSAQGAYQSKEMFIIKWGGAAEQLRISRPTINDPNTPADSSDDYIEPGGGPSEVFVDDNENLIVRSYEFAQLKGFDKSGTYLFSLMPPERTPGGDICAGHPRSMYIDSSFNIYLISDPPLSYVPVVDYQGNLGDRLYPFNDSSEAIAGLCWPTFDRIVFFARSGNEATYVNGIFQRGGTCALLRQDGYYYSAMLENDSSLIFFRSQVHDMANRSATSESLVISFPEDTIYSVDLLPGGDEAFIYIFIMKWSYPSKPAYHGVWCFDLAFNRIDEVELAPPMAPYSHFIRPFIARDGSIYEFRCQDDGLHVLKWTKEQ